MTIAVPPSKRQRRVGLGIRGRRLDGAERDTIRPRLLVGKGLTENKNMGAGFESEWDSAWFAGKAAQCMRLARGCTRKDVIETLTAMAEDFMAQSELASKLQKEASAPENDKTE